MFSNKRSSLTHMGFSYAEPFLSVLPSATKGSSGFSPSPLQAPACHKAAIPHLSLMLFYTVCHLSRCKIENK